MSWWWPFSWGRGNYTDAITAALEGMASAGPVPSPAATAAAEACAGIIARSLAAATVRPASGPASAVTPAWLRRLGYDLVRQGEHLAAIDVDRTGRVTLTAASSWTFSGDWRALAQIPHPDASQTRSIARGGYVALVWAENELQPWRGRGPLSGASLTSGLLAAAHRSLGAEQAMPHTHILPVPKSDQTETTKLENAIKNGAGKVVLGESTTGAWSHGPAEAPRGDYRSQRIGADPPAGSVDLQDMAARQVIAACGLSPALLLGGTGAEAREDYRRFVTTVVEPLGRIVAGELAGKLDTPDLALTFEALHAHDMAGRARAAGSLVKAGWTPAEAAAAVGLDPPAAQTEPSTTAVGSEAMADGSG
ncbi:MAG: phage portal protein [Caldilineaceae bacterium SB0668_bin_21]|nr:phage portal protein [Caldilineaceae bacterium SB0668_bin_21]MXX24371.1 phage portal protein [Caldilineaceae bacterium SB0668_bin_21]